MAENENKGTGTKAPETIISTNKHQTGDSADRNSVMILETADTVPPPQPLSQGSDKK